ncbi:hypothetical protein [Pseudoalteromonas denitrificans]|uniref:Uncharacterized protein n=1 Tax=Pseudoalteromonas denitrificans DSM 6059 TaxID=1123010 RepID=A0A1I1RKP4_9GAMM|nr:hypothetical protein [Pseudoalteromonas denitrificans]SFD34881.1 hypothetical protein SAMN02745724_04274 [Pseudoalteromonas denitrificans DSM 6059]
MKLKLNKKKMKNLSEDHKALPAKMTAKVAGGANANTPCYTAGTACSMEPCKWEEY